MKATFSICFFIYVLFIILTAGDMNSRENNMKMIRACSRGNLEKHIACIVQCWPKLAIDTVAYSRCDPVWPATVCIWMLYVYRCKIAFNWNYSSRWNIINGIVKMRCYDQSKHVLRARRLRPLLEPSGGVQDGWPQKLVAFNSNYPPLKNQLAGAEAKGGWHWQWQEPCMHPPLAEQVNWS